MKKKKKASKGAGSEIPDKAPPQKADSLHDPDPESDSRSWRYAWESAWRPGLEVRW